MMDAVTVHELKDILENGEDVQLIDVREPHEHAAFNIGGHLIPFGEIIEKAGMIANDKPVYLYCEKGIRSMIAIQRLQQKFHFKNVFNVTGGMSAWKKAFPFL